MSLWKQARSFTLSLLRRSFRSHASFQVADVERSLAFYTNLGFRRVISSRGNEVTLLRNDRGDELNLVAINHPEGVTPTAMVASFPVRNLNDKVEAIRGWYGELEVLEDSVTRSTRLIDPDLNVLELFETVARDARREADVYLIATRSELVTGLTDHYFIPPDRENRFVCAHPGSAFMTMAWNRVARETGESPYVVTLDEHKLQLDEQVVSAEDLDNRAARRLSTYPHVYSPIERNALLSAGKCVQSDGQLHWPGQFEPIDHLTAVQTE